MDYSGPSGRLRRRPMSICIITFLTGEEIMRPASSTNNVLAWIDERSFRGISRSLSLAITRRAQPYRPISSIPAQPGFYLH